MDGKALRDKLVGSDDERAVSPVIGVILMVAITVILAAVIATLVMDFGDSTDAPINAHVTSDVDESNTEVTLTVEEAGEASNFVLRGSALSSEVDPGLSGQTGDSVTIDYSSWGSGQVNIVAVDGDREENAGSFEV